MNRARKVKGNVRGEVQGASEWYVLPRANAAGGYPRLAHDLLDKQIIRHATVDRA